MDQFGAYRKRQKISIACQVCRDRKTRCDGQRPTCGSCLRRNLNPDQCVYSGADTSSQERYVRDLEQRVQELEYNAQRSHQQYSWDSSAVSSTERDALMISSSDRDGLDMPPRSTSAVSSQDSLSIDASRSSSISNIQGSGTTYLSPFRIPQRDMSDPGGNSAVGLPSGPSPACVESSTALGFVAEIDQASNEVQNLDLEDISIVPGRPMVTKDSPTLSASDEDDEDTSVVRFLIPPRRIADKFLEAYWTGVHPLQPFIFRTRFMTWYNSLWNGHSESDLSKTGNGKLTSQLEQTFHCMLNLMIALGCRYLAKARPNRSNANARTEKIYFERATNLLTLDIMDHISLPLIQTTLLMSHYIQSLNISHRGWMSVGLAIRAIQGIALQTDVIGASQVEREERRRTWYYAVLLERLQSLTYGKPPSLSSREAVPIPQMVDEDFLVADPAAQDGTQPMGEPPKCSYFVFVITLSNISSDISRFLFSASTGALSSTHSGNDYNSILRLNEELNKWREGLPPYLYYNHLSETPDTADLFLRFSILLHYRFLHSRIMLLRQAMVELAIKSSKVQAHSELPSLHQTLEVGIVEACTSSAEELLHIIHPRLGTLLVPPACYTVSLIYTAGTVLAVIFRAPMLSYNQDPVKRQRLENSWNLCIESLSHYRKAGVPFAQKCLSNIQKMYRGSTSGGEQLHTEGTRSSQQQAPLAGTDNLTQDVQDANAAMQDNLVDWGYDPLDQVQLWNFEWPDDDTNWLNGMTNF